MMIKPGFSPNLASRLSRPIQASIIKFSQSGALMLGSPPQINSAVAAMRKQGLDYVRMSNDELTARYPGSFAKIPDMEGLMDPAGGTLKADKALAAMWAYIKSSCDSCRIHDEEQVKEIKPGRPVQITTDKGTYTSDNLVICAGPWAGRILARLGVNVDLKVILVKVLFWKSKNPDTQFNHLTPPVLLYHSGPGMDRSTNCYGVPPPEKAGLYKVCAHSGPLTNPDDRDGAVSVEDHLRTIGFVEKVVQKYMPGLEPTPAIVDSCMYTVTPDHHPILDSVPGHSNVVYGCGFSGHGFKLAPVVGNILADLATGRTPTHDVTPFRADRFKHPATSKL